MRERGSFLRGQGLTGVATFSHLAGRCKRHAVAAASAAILMIVSSGCGGSDKPAVDADQVSAMITESVGDRLPAGATMAPPDCVRDGAGSNFTCVAIVRMANGAVERVSVAVTCDAGTGRCVSRPQ